MDIRTHEVLSVLFQHVIDLVEQIVGLLSQLLATLLPGGRAAGEVVVLAAVFAALGVLPLVVLGQLGLVVGLAAAVTALQTKRYTSSTQFFVSVLGADTAQLSQGSTFTSSG